MSLRRPAPRHSRRILAWAVGGFVAIQLAGGVALDYAWPDVRFPSLKAMLGRLAAEPRSPDVLILGSSRFHKTIDVTELTCAVRDGTGDAEFRAFQGAVGASDAITMELAMDRILAAGGRPKLVIVEMTPTTIAKNTRWYSWHVDRQLRWHDLPGHLPEIIPAGQTKALVQDRLVPLYWHRYEILKTLRIAAGVFTPEKLPEIPPADRPRQPLSDADWAKWLEPRPLTPEEAARATEGIALVRREQRDFAPEGNALAAMDRMLAKCRQAGVAVVLVGAPVTSAYRDTFPPIDAAYRDVVAGLCARHGVSFLDAHAALPDHLFADFHHATPDGGRVFARWLARRLVIPWSNENKK